MRTLIATMIGYALFYFVRKNFSLAMPGLEADLGISKTSLGIFLTLNGLVYGLSRFVNGILADRLNARFFMATGLALCALANFAFGFGVDVSEWITGESSGSQFNNTLILFMGVMWVVNGMLQGTASRPARGCSPTGFRPRSWPPRCRCGTPRIRSARDWSSSSAATS